MVCSLFPDCWRWAVVATSLAFFKVGLLQCWNISGIKQNTLWSGFNLEMFNALGIFQTNPSFMRIFCCCFGCWRSKIGKIICPIYHIKCLGSAFISERNRLWTVSFEQKKCLWALITHISLFCSETVLQLANDIIWFCKESYRISNAVKERKIASSNFSSVYKNLANPLKCQ